jgi:hypothetical protein
VPSGELGWAVGFFWRNMRAFVIEVIEKCSLERVCPQGYFEQLYHEDAGVKRI